MCFRNFSNPREFDQRNHRESLGIPPTSPPSFPLPSSFWNVTLKNRVVGQEGLDKSQLDKMYERQEFGSNLLSKEGETSQIFGTRSVRRVPGGGLRFWHDE